MYLRYQRVNRTDTEETSGQGQQCVGGLSIVIVVSPLLALMNDQIAKFEQRGLKCLLLRKILVCNPGVVHGDYQLLYLTPEYLLQELSLRELFCSSVYNSSCCEYHHIDVPMYDGTNFTNALKFLTK